MSLHEYNSVCVCVYDQIGYHIARVIGALEWYLQAAKEHILW